MDLGAWNQRLVGHFEALAHSRPKDIPLFALEHGLTQSEVVTLSSQLQAHVRVAPPARDHRLVWVVYAAEIGYGYAGDEYWQTFEEKTPGWIPNGKRGWIRDAFAAFQEQYAGAKPSGPWAEQFSIIAWPITHAILPRDLQQHLARILYDMRWSFSAELFESPLLFGQQIFARRWNASSRFQTFVQRPALVGQIATALLLGGTEGFGTLIEPATLQRIGADLDLERRSREWLRTARRAAEERASVRGLSRGGSATPIRRREDARAEVARLGIEPRLVLRPMEEGRWEVSLELPDFSPLLLRFPQAEESLTNSRCRVTGSSGRPLARGRLLNGAQRVPLAQWPKPDEVLLQFDHVDPQLEYLLRTECLLRPGPCWLFRIASDGLGYECRGMRVRSGERYLLVTVGARVDTGLGKSVTLACEGVSAVLLDLPEAITAEWEEALRLLDLTQARSIEVWPAGLAALAWDNEGQGEWLASERPILAIRSDHRIDELAVGMDDDLPLTLDLADSTPGEPIFIELPPLPLGVHSLRVIAGDSSKAELVGTLSVAMRVRPTRSWTPGTPPQSALDVDVEPASPSLEQLWENKVAVIVRGPAGRYVRCRVQMLVRDAEAPLFEKRLPPVGLPLSSEEWVHHLDAHLKHDKAAQRAYDDAQVCEVEFAADELGRFTLRCERAFTPLRWTLRQRKRGFSLRLHDDAGGADPHLEYTSFEFPTQTKALTTGSLVDPAPGGLYCASTSDFAASIIVPPEVRDPSHLQFAPQIEQAGSADVKKILRLLDFAHVWATARLPGNVFAQNRRDLVLRAMAMEVAASLAGSLWRNAEGAFRSSSQLEKLAGYISTSPFERQRLTLDYRALVDLTPLQRVERLAASSVASGLGRVGSSSVQVVAKGAGGVRVTKAVLAVGPDDNRWLAELSLRIASAPWSVLSWAGRHTESGIKKLLEVPTLMRAARLMVLAVDQQKKSLAAAGEIYAGWVWSA